MRNRSKSVHDNSHPESSESEEDYDLNLSYTDDSDEENNETIPAEITVAKHSECSLTVDEQLELIGKVRSLIPLTDKLAFDERLKKINWAMIPVGDHGAEEISSEFGKIINNVRKLRTLDEIINDAQNEIIPQLGLMKPVPAFALFMRDNKEKIAQLCGTPRKAGEYARIASDMFRNCSEKERDRYRSLAIELKLKYHNALEKYRKKRVPVKKIVKMKDIPAQLFVQAKTLDSNASRKQIRKDYQVLDKGKKLKWILRWLGLKKGEKANMAQYEKCISKLSKDEMAMFDEYEGRPQVLSAFQLFVRDFIANSGSYRLGIQQWATFDQKKKAEYSDQAAKAKKEFTANFTRFVASLPKDRQESEIKSLSVPKRTPLKKKYSKTDKKEESESDNEINSLSSPKKNRKKKNDSIKEKNDESKSQSDSELDENEISFLSEPTIKLRKTPVEKSVSKTVKLEESEPQSDSELDEDDRPQTIFECDTTIAHHQNQEIEKEGREEDDEVVTTVIIPPTTVSNQKRLTSPEFKCSPKKRKVSESHSTPSKLPEKKFKKFTSSQSDNSDFTSPNRKENELSSPIKKKKRKSKHSDDDEAASSTKHSERNDFILEQCKALLALKPSEVVVEYYASQNYNGSLKKAKKAFKSLTQEEQNAITKQHKKATDKYLRKFEGFVATLTPNELSRLSDKCLI